MSSMKLEEIPAKYGAILKQNTGLSMSWDECEEFVGSIVAECNIHYQSDNRELVEAMEKLQEWQEKYPPGRIYPWDMAATMERELTEIVEYQLSLIQKHNHE